MLSCDTAGVFGSSGFVALTTPSSFCSFPTVSAMVLAIGPERTVASSGASNTTCALAPFAPAPKRWPIRFSAVVDSCPGMENVLTVAPDSVAAPTPAITSSSSQTAATTVRCRYAPSPRRCRKVAIVSSLGPGPRMAQGVVAGGDQVGADVGARGVAGGEGDHGEAAERGTDPDAALAVLFLDRGERVEQALGDGLEPGRDLAALERA